LSREHIDHRDIVQFAKDRVNLPADKAKIFREQVWRLREKLESFLAEHPDFSLKKILLSGSLAKGHALRSLNDIDIACYISGVGTSTDVGTLLQDLVERLRSAFPNLNPDQITPQTYSVTISFRGTALDIDVVPIIYNGDENWNGHLISQDNGAFLKTSIPRHLEFARLRKRQHPTDFSQVVRLAKFWAELKKTKIQGFRFKSFMIEMILAHLCDQGMDFSDYPEALNQFFNYMIKSRLQEKIIFEDYYSSSEVPSYFDPVQIIDPVNSENNVAMLYTVENRNLIIDAAMEAGDAIDSAFYATTKSETVRYWQKVLGAGFTA